jgi:ATP-dependent Lon protease
MASNRRSEREIDATQRLCNYLCDSLEVYADARRMSSIRGYLPHKLFEARNLSELEDRLEFLSKEAETRLQSYIGMLQRRGPFIRMAMAPSQEAVAPLRTRFPHFTAVLDWIEGHLALAQAAGSAALELPPFLLGGDPGVGKTYFAKHLAEALTVNYTEISMSSTTGGFTIGGLDLGWSTGQAGRVFCTLVQDGLANPLILLDELDKVSRSGNNDVLGAMYGLLEPGTARRFKDEAVQLEMDASRILWIATANDLENIPSPILSRLHTFIIPTPNEQEGRQIAAQVYSDLRSQHVWGSSFAEALESEVLTALSATPPRAMRRALASAASHAARHGRRIIQLQDLETPQRRQPMGFI